MTETEIKRRKEELRVLLEEVREDVKVLDKMLDGALPALNAVKTEEDARAFETRFESVEASLKHIELFYAGAAYALPALY